MVRESKEITIGSVQVGGNAPIVVQSMCATKTSDVEATLKQVELLKSHGANLVRLAVDSPKDVAALAEISSRTDANLVVDLQENFRLAEKIAPLVVKFRYNPGHLFHHQRQTPMVDIVRYLVDIAGEHNCAIRIGVNFGSLDPARANTQSPIKAALDCAIEHCDFMAQFGFSNYLVSLKSSDPYAVIDINKRFAAVLPQVPLHLGVTEAGMLPEGILKTRVAFEGLIPEGIGDTVRVSLTVPNHLKYKEVLAAEEILNAIDAQDFLTEQVDFNNRLNIIACPSCSRVENARFVDLAQAVRDAASFASERPIKIAVMGCRVNGPGETDDADIGLWCAPSYVNLKRGKELVGRFGYEEIIERVMEEIRKL